MSLGVPVLRQKGNLLIASLSLLWLLDQIASCSMTFALYLAIILESTHFTDLGSNILKTRHMFVVLISTFCEL